MKAETGSFIPTAGTHTIVLNDTTLDVKEISFSVVKVNGSQAARSEGSSDSVTNIGNNTISATGNSGRESTTYCVYHYEDVSGTATARYLGYVDASGFSTTGEIAMTFDNYSGTAPVHFTARGV